MGFFNSHEDITSIDTLVCGTAVFVLCLSEMRDMIFACAISCTMTDHEAFQRLKRLGCNYMEPCVDLNHVEKIKDNVRMKYMTDLETYLFPAEFSGEFKEKLHYALGFKIPYHLIHPPKGVQ